MNQVECCFVNVVCIVRQVRLSLQVVVFGVRNGMFSVKIITFFY